MPKPRRKTKALTLHQIKEVLTEIAKRRHPEKNTAIIQLCFSLGLTAQEIANLKISDIAYMSSYKDKQLLLSDHIVIRPKKAQAKQVDNNQKHWGYNISCESFDAIIMRVVEDTLKGKEILTSNYYPNRKQYQKSLRILPLSNNELIDALNSYLMIRSKQISDSTYSKKQIEESPFFLTQKLKSYSPNTLQEHIKLMLADWSDIKEATSLSGRSTFISLMLDDGVAIKDIQKFLGHSSASTTILHNTPNINHEYLVCDLRLNRSFN